MDPKLKTFFTIIITALIVGGGIYFWQQSSSAPNETQMTNGAASDETENMKTEREDSRLFEGDGFVFNYPADWTMEIKEVNNTVFYEEGTQKMFVYTFDVMGIRCLLSDNRDFVDSKGRKWTYSVLRTGLPEGAEIACGKYEEDESAKRTAEMIRLTDSADNYIASLSFIYDYVDTDQEKEELSKFEAILDSIHLD